MTGPVANLYRERVLHAEIASDPAQLLAAELLDDLGTALAARGATRGGFFGGLRRQKPDAVRGIYLHGAVGRGKTMLMDMFFASVPVAPKRRWHFHEFMSEVHDRIARGRATTDGDPIPYVAAEIASEAQLLCFDELQVTDIADAMILGRLFKEIFDRGVVVVATSNTAPERLYWNGLNRQLFLPFIGHLQENLRAFELAAAKDYRLEKLAGRQLYFTPVDDKAHREIESHWLRLTGHHPATEDVLEVKSRRIRVPAASMGVARFHFADLCALPMGAIDYLHIAHVFHTVIIEGIPVLSAARRNEARRLVTLVDTLYDNGVCLIASAEAEPHRLYVAGDGSELFERTASRLVEMRSEAYLQGRVARAPAVAGSAH